MRTLIHGLIRHLIRLADDTLPWCRYGHAWHWPATADATHDEHQPVCIQCGKTPNDLQAAR